MSQIKAVIYLPLSDNKGADLSALIEETRDRVFETFGGWTRHGEVTGAYRMEDKSRALDHSVVYTVVMEEGGLVELEDILRDYCIRAGQESVYLEIERAVEIRFVR